MTNHVRILTMIMLVGLASARAVTPAHADDLCPDTTKASNLAVDDPADMQFDIDRLALCLQRARLLQQIDETVKKREQIRLQPLDTGLTGGLSGVNGAFPAIPSMPALPDMPARAASVTPVVATPAPQKIVNADWRIQRIWGQGEGMQAQLVQDDMIANVKLHDVLPSGEKVTELSARGVTLDKGGAPHSLKWFEAAKRTERNASRVSEDNPS